MLFISAMFRIKTIVKFLAHSTIKKCHDDFGKRLSDALSFEVYRIENRPNE